MGKQFTKAEENFLCEITRRYWLKVLSTTEIADTGISKVTLEEEDLFPQDLLVHGLIPVFCKEREHTRRELGIWLDDMRKKVAEQIPELKDALQHSPALSILRKRVSIKKKSNDSWEIMFF